MAIPSLLAQEAEAAGAAVTRQVAAAGPLLAELGARLRQARPAFVATCARGSSDHACTYGKYLIETALGCPVASIGPSVASVPAALSLAGGLFVVVSQSGRSPDLLRLTEAARASESLVVGFVNDLDSPLPGLCDICVPLSAGRERSVAATKSCLAAMAAFLQLVAHWSEDAGLRAQVEALPGVLGQARACDWSPGLAPLAAASSLYVVGRGVGLGIALEMALKLKESCGLHAEAFSAAEVMHGPLALVRPGFPVLVLAQEDEAAAQARETAARMAALGAQVSLAGGTVPGVAVLPTLEGLPAATAPLAALQSFYMALESLARARGRDPDSPPHLRKVTETA